MHTVRSQRSPVRSTLVRRLYRNYTTALHITSTRSLDMECPLHFSRNFCFSSYHFTAKPTCITLCWVTKRPWDEADDESDLNNSKSEDDSTPAQTLPFCALSSVSVKKIHYDKWDLFLFFGIFAFLPSLSLKMADPEARFKNRRRRKWNEIKADGTCHRPPYHSVSVWNADRTPRQIKKGHSRWWTSSHSMEITEPYTLSQYCRTRNGELLIDQIDDRFFSIWFKKSSLNCKNTDNRQKNRTRKRFWLLDQVCEKI